MSDLGRDLPHHDLLPAEEGVPGRGHQPPGLHAGHRGGRPLPDLQGPGGRQDKREPGRHLGN